MRNLEKPHANVESRKEENHRFSSNLSWTNGAVSRLTQVGNYRSSELRDLEAPVFRMRSEVDLKSNKLFCNKNDASELAMRLGEELHRNCSLLDQTMWERSETRHSRRFTIARFLPLVEAVRVFPVGAQTLVVKEGVLKSKFIEPISVGVTLRRAIVVHPFPSDQGPVHAQAFSWLERRYSHH